MNVTPFPEVTIGNKTTLATVGRDRWPCDTEFVRSVTPTANVNTAGRRRRRAHVAHARIGFDLIDQDRGGGWENVVFLVLWLCGLVAIGYGANAVLALFGPA